MHRSRCRSPTLRALALQIDASNVKRLGLMWSYELGDGGGDQEATPLVWNNTVFAVTNWSI